MAATKTKTRRKNSTPKPAAKASTTAKPKAASKPADLLAVGDFAVFNGYATETSKDETVFKEGDQIAIVSVEDDDDNGTTYLAIPVSDWADFVDGGSDLDNVEDGGEVAPAECTRMKGKALATAEEQFRPIILVGRMGDILSEHGGDALEAAIAQNEMAQESYFYLGGALANVIQNGLHEDNYPGETGFNDFCEAEFGFKESKGRALARMYTTFAAIPDFDPSKLKDIGWSKANMIQKYATDENIDELIDTASKATQRALPEVLVEKFADTEGKTPSGKAASRATVTYKAYPLRFTDDTFTGVDRAVQAVKKEHGLATNEEAIEHIVMQYAVEHMSEASAKKVASPIERARKAREKAIAAKAAKAKPADKDKPAAKGKPAAKRPRGKK